MMALTITLLPEPVAPAIKRCGMLARSRTCGVPPTSFPSANGIACVGVQDPALPVGVRSGLKRIASASWFGISMPTTAFPGIGASMRIERALSAMARSSPRPSMRLMRTFGAGVNSYCVTTGPGFAVTEMISMPRSRSFCTMIAALAWWILAFGLTAFPGASRRLVEGSSQETAPSARTLAAGAAAALVAGLSAPRREPPDRTFAPPCSSGTSVSASSVAGVTCTGGTLMTGRFAASVSARASSAARAASRSCMIRSRSAASLSTPSPRTSAPTFAPAKRVAKSLRTVDSARMSPIAIRTPIHAANAPMPVSRLAAPPPAMLPMRPPWVGKTISTRASRPTMARSDRAMRSGTREAVARRRSIHIAKPISNTGTSQRPAPNHGASTSRSTSASAPRPGRISPTAKMTPVTAKARESSVRSAERDASGLRRAWRLVLSPPRFAIA